MSNSQDWNTEPPLSKVTCTSAACDRDLHSFLRVRPRGQSYRNEQCRECGVDLIDWARLDRHDLRDVGYTVEALERELIRHVYWHSTIDLIAIRHARRKGLSGLLEATNIRLRKYVGPPRSQLFRDGMQTPLSGNIIYYAQHATATCCRKCIEAWHGIDRERPLTEEELGYMNELVTYYINRRMPDLAQHGIKVPKSGSGKSKVA